jgi:hypothetical protein
MGEVIIIGVDLAKNVFQVHGAAADGSVVFRKKLSRPQFARFMADHLPCLVAMEACASAHHWAREMARYGHEVRLIAPHYVKPFIKRQKNDAADAEAIVEAALRPDDQNFLANRAASTKEGWISGPSPPPLAPAKAFSPSGCGRIFPLFSRVMRDGQLTGPGAKSLGSSLSGPIFSGPINRARFGSERHATEIIRLRVGAHWAGFAVPFAKPLEPGSNDQRTALSIMTSTAPVSISFWRTTASSRPALDAWLDMTTPARPLSFR